MRIRIKYSKNGILKYIGHLDTMRFFQKALRRAGFDVVYSEGFSPHMIMSFALPLGVGLTSEGEYFDLEVRSVFSSPEMKDSLNAQMPEEIKVLNIVKVQDDKASKCMTLVAAADYDIILTDMGAFPPDWKELLEAFLQKKEIMVLKKTKKNEKLTDIRPLIYDYKIKNDMVSFRLSAGSVDNLKPSLVMDAFCDEIKTRPESVSYQTHRKELLLSDDGIFYPLDHFGEVI